MDCPSRGQAELVVRLANLGVAGDVRLPAVQEPCADLLSRIEGRMNKALARFRELAANRTRDERKQRDLVEVLQRWFVLGRQPPRDEAAAGVLEPTETEG